MDEADDPLVLPDDDPGPVEAALSHAAGFLRSRMGRAVRMRRVPELRFSQDTASRRGLEISRLIDEAVADEDSSGLSNDERPGQ